MSTLWEPNTQMEKPQGILHAETAIPIGEACMTQRMGMLLNKETIEGTTAAKSAIYKVQRRNSGRADPGAGKESAL